MDDGRRVVLGVTPGVRRLLGDGLPQKAVAVPLAHALVDGIFEGAAHEVHILAPLAEKHSEAGVLADGNAVAGGDVRVLHELAEDLTPDGRLLGLSCFRKRVVHVLRQIVVGKNTHRLHGSRDLVDVQLSDGAHTTLLSPPRDQTRARIDLTRPDQSFFRSAARFRASVA